MHAAPGNRLTLPDAMQLAMAAYQRGDLREAERLCALVLAASPDHLDALNLSGALRLRGGRPDLALARFDRVVAIRPDYPDGFNNRGVALKSLGRVEEATLSFRRAIQLRPGFADAHSNLASALVRLRRYDEAILAYGRAVELKPDLAEAHNNLGVALTELRRYEEALASYGRATAINPRFAEALKNAGTVLVLLGRYDEGVASLRRALALMPDSAEVLHELGRALGAAGRTDEAVACYDRVNAMRPDLVDAFIDRGMLLQGSGRPEEALASYDRAVALEPERAEAHYNRAGALRELRRYEEAIASYERAIALKPGFGDACWNMGLVRLVRGEYEAGWELYEWRWKRGTDPRVMPHAATPLWQGRGSLSGKTILLHAEQGLGDTIQFARYAPLVEALGAHVILEVQPALVRLLSSLGPGIRVVPAGAQPSALDFHCPLMSLPLAFGTTLDSVPAPVPYLSADAGRAEAWRRRLGPRARPRIGLVWSGSTGHRNDRNRSVPLEAFRDLLTMDVEFHCLQNEIRASDADFRRSTPALRTWDTELTDFAETAALASAMDLVISVDTSVAHLVGAMNRPVWIMLPYAPDWRWLSEGSTSVWYPSARLFRQRRLGDWASVTRDVVTAVRCGAVSAAVR